MEYSFCFVILHYKTIDDTVKCVKSILENITGVEFRIIIVDNYSNDGTGEKLQEIYMNLRNVEILINQSNLGFSRGNNVGYLYAKRKYKSDFIVLLNNDTYILKNDFCKIILNEYNKSKFAVLGPKIFTPYNNSERCNPMRLKPITNSEINTLIIKFRIYIILNYFKLDLYYIKFKEYLKKTLNYKNEVTDFCDYNKRMTDVQLHGCCLIFSPTYIKRYNGLDDRTFLYMEEDLLFIEMQKKGLLTVYNPKLSIFHSEEVTSLHISNKQCKQRRNKYINILKSADIVKKTLLNK